jgi:hypothetical protein
MEYYAIWKYGCSGHLKLLHRNRWCHQITRLSAAQLHDGIGGACCHDPDRYHRVMDSTQPLRA